jgi:hypothetical protein
MEFMLKAEKKLKSFSLFGNKKEEALELYQKGAVGRVLFTIVHQQLCLFYSVCPFALRFASSKQRSGRRQATRA